MMHDPPDAPGGELLPADVPPADVTPALVADLSERFYELFADVQPRGPRDLAYFYRLLVDFGAQLDVAEELNRFHAWSLDKGGETLANPRSRFRGWLRKGLTYHRHHGGRR